MANSTFGYRILVDKDFCMKSSVANDNWGRQGVTPFAISCYIYHAIHTLGKPVDEVIHAVTAGKWDSLYWGNSPISITIWNKLFNGSVLSDEEWSKILFPAVYIKEVYTSVTTPTRKHECYPMFFGLGHNVTDFLICTKEAYEKAIRDKSSVKVTTYRYGVAADIRDVIQGLREETTKVVIPVR